MIPPLPVPKDDGVIELDHEHLDKITHTLLHSPSATATEKGMANIMLAMLTERARLYERLEQ